MSNGDSNLQEKSSEDSLANREGSRCCKLIEEVDHRRSSHTPAAGALAQKVSV